MVLFDSEAAHVAAARALLLHLGTTPESVGLEATLTTTPPLTEGEDDTSASTSVATLAEGSAAPTQDASERLYAKAAIDV